MNSKNKSWLGSIIATSSVGLICIAIQFAQPSPLAWRYDRMGVLEGEIWRLVTGAWVHLSFIHLVVNIIGLALVLMLFKKSIRTSSVILLVAIISTASHVLLLGYTSLPWGVGLSGGLHGLFIYLALVHVWAVARSFTVFLLIGLGLKLFTESWLNIYTANHWLAGHTVALPLHWAGTAAGFIIAILVLILKIRITTRIS